MTRFFDFFGGEGKKPKTEVEVDIGGLEEWFEKQAAEEFKEVYREGDALLRRLRDIGLSVRKAAEEFSRTEIKVGELEKHLLPVMRSSRDGVASKVVGVVSKFEFPVIKKFDSLVEASRAVSQALLQIDQVLKTHRRVVSTTLSKQIHPLLLDLKQLRGEAALLLKLVEENADMAARVGKTRVEIKQLIDMNADLASSHVVIEDAKRSAEEAEVAGREISVRMEEVKRSKRYEDALRIAGEADEIALGLANMRAEFDNLFSNLRKPLEKYIYSASLSKEERRLLELYLESPSAALIEDSELVVDRLLGDLGNRVKEGKLAVKNVKTPDRVEEIRSVLKSRRDAVKKMADDLEGRHVSLQRSLLKEVEDMQREIEEKRVAREKQLLFIEEKRADTEKSLKELDKLAAKVEADATEVFGVLLKIKRRSPEAS